MFEAQYGKEPFDLRLTVLRFIRNIHVIILVTVLGTLVFGGGYYVKNILLVTGHYYKAASTYKVEYTDEPSKAGDYYINEMSWNTYVQSGDFLNALTKKMDEMGIRQIDNEELAAMLSATLASDIHVPSVTVTTESGDLSMGIERAVEETMTGYFADTNPQIREIKVIDQAVEAEEVEPDVRPVRALILSAILSCFFAVTVFLLYEMGNDSVWLPASVRKRYGIKCVGTAGSEELSTNIEYIFRDIEKAAVCTVEIEADPKAAAAILEDSAQHIRTEWIPVPAPLTFPESVQCIREMDGLILSVNAGSHAGKKLERVLEFMKEQDIDVTAVLLNNADEWLIRAYYLIPKSNPDDVIRK